MPNIQARLFPIAVLLISFLLYFSIVSASALAPLSMFFGRYSHLLLVALIAVLLVTSRLPPRYGDYLNLLLILSFCALILLYKWTSGYSDNGVIGGLLPYKDGRNYYSGMQAILDGQLISKDGLQAAGRPLFPGFLAIILLMTGMNLQLALAVIMAGAAVGTYGVGCLVNKDMGRLPAILLTALLVCYILVFGGYTMSESAGYIFGCLAFIILWSGARDLDLVAYLIGLVVLTMALSIRTGAFFMIPMLILWAGFVFRAEKRFAWKVAGLATVVSALTLLTLNFIYPRFIVEPGGITSGNFAYMLYGQVRGGVGWHAALEAYPSRDPGIILRASLTYFQKHPLSFFVAVAKSYWQFLFSNFGMFEAIAGRGVPLLDSALWLLRSALLVSGVLQCLRHISQPKYSFALAGFGGVLLSVPFLPPIDGGSRFYASSAPFIFLVPALGTLLFSRKEVVNGPSPASSRSRIVSYVCLAITIAFVVAPVIIQRNRNASNFNPNATCPTGEEQVAVRVYPGSYIDLVHNGVCGLVPSVCMGDLERNGTDKTTDDFFQALVQQAKNYYPVMRVMVAPNLAKGPSGYIIGTPSQLDPTRDFSEGCATLIRTTNQNIYKIDSISSP